MKINIIFFLLIVTSMMYQGNSEENFNKTLDEYVTSVYSNSLADMLDLMDDMVDACDDFFTHACGNEVNQSGKVPLFLSNHEDRMHFFTESKNKFATAAGKNLQVLYDKCKKRSGDSRVQWRHILSEVDFLEPYKLFSRHFPILHYQWQKLIHFNAAHQISWVPLTAHFAAHGIATFWDIFFTEQTVFIASPADSIDINGSGGIWRCPNWADITATLKLLLRGRNAQASIIVGRELWELCMELTEGDMDRGVKEDEFLLHDDIIAYFEIFFRTLNISDVEVAVARKLPINVSKLYHILQVVHKTQPRILFNFIMWRAFDQLRYMDCFQLTAEFESAILAEYWHWHIFQPRLSRDVTLALYLFHTARYHSQERQHLNAALSWEHILWCDHHSETEHLRRKNLARLRAVELLIRDFARNRLSADALAPIYYENFGNQKKFGFYSHLVHLRRQKLRQSFYVPYIDFDNSNDPAYKLRHFLYFAISIIKRPLFHYFASIDFDLWYDNQSRLTYTSDDFHTVWNCLTLNLVQPLSEDEAIAIYQFGRTFNAVYKDYQFWLEAQTFAFAEDFFLNYFGMDRQRVLFYAITQMYCGRNNALYKPRVNRTFQQMRKFRVAFNCTNEAQLEVVNPDASCF